MPATIRSVSRFLPDLSQINNANLVLMTSLLFRHVIDGSLVFVSIGTYLTESGSAFSVTLTTIAFDYSSLRWFEVFTYMTTSRGRPSSLVKHDYALD